MYLDWAWVGTTKNMSKEPISMSKNLPLTYINENFVGCLTSTCLSTCFSFFITLPSTYFFSLESLIMTNASAKGENCI
jgi:hypothetical protein